MLIFKLIDCTLWNLYNPLITFQNNMLCTLKTIEIIKKKKKQTYLCKIY